MKQLTLKQVEGRQAKAVGFLQGMLDDPDRAAEVEAESAEDYAARRGFQIVNPEKEATKMAKTVAQLRAEIADLKDEVDELTEENETLTDQLDAVADAIGVEEEEEEDDEADEPGE